eukprot:6373082-Alexandrium_andersonii.AAC.1
MPFMIARSRLGSRGRAHCCCSPPRLGQCLAVRCRAECSGSPDFRAANRQFLSAGELANSN